MSLATRLTLAMVFLVFQTAMTVGLLAYLDLEKSILPGALERTEIHTRLLASELESYGRSARGDVLGYRASTALEGMMRAHQFNGVDPVDGTTEAVWAGRLAGRFLAELSSKPAYSQIRIITAGNDAREVVRVDRLGPSGAPRIVSGSELQSKQRKIPENLFASGRSCRIRTTVADPDSGAAGIAPGEPPADAGVTRRLLIPQSQAQNG